MDLAEGHRKKSLKCLTIPDEWEDALGPPVVRGLRSTFLNEFQPERFGGFQETKLRNRKQGPTESGMDYYYDVVNLCRLIDVNMPESMKLSHLFRGLQPDLMKKIWIKRPPTCAQFLSELKIHAEVEELANPVGHTVAVLCVEGKKVAFQSPRLER